MKLKISLYFFLSLPITRIYTIQAPPWRRKLSLFLPGGGACIEFFFTAELSHFLGQKNQKNIFLKKNIFSKIIFGKNIFFQFYFLLQKLVTFWDKKIKKIFFLKFFRKFRKCFSKIWKKFSNFFVKTFLVFTRGGLYCVNSGRSFFTCFETSAHTFSSTKLLYVILFDFLRL